MKKNHHFMLLFKHFNSLLFLSPSSHMCLLLTIILNTQWKYNFIMIFVEIHTKIIFLFLFLFLKQKVNIQQKQNSIVIFVETDNKIIFSLCISFEFKKKLNIFFVLFKISLDLVILQKFSFIFSPHKIKMWHFFIRSTVR